MQKKKSGVKKCLEILPLKGGGGVGRPMANAILNFHFDFLHTSLSENLAWMCSPEHHSELDPSQPGLVQAVPRQLRTRLATWLPLNIVSCIGGIHIA